MKTSARALLSSIVVLAAAAAGPAGCGSDDPAPAGTPPVTSTDDGGGVAQPAADGVWLVTGPDVAPVVKERIGALLTTALGKAVAVVDASAVPASLTATSLVIALGDNALTRALVPAADRAALAPEAFVLKSGALRGGTLLAADGAPAKNHPHGNLGVLHGAYAALEELGFGFLHPLAPTVPSGLALPAAPVDRHETPRWDVREVHLHTMHPLEMTELLQGWGESGPSDLAGFEKRLPEWDRYLEWLVANGQNGVEWFLLWADSWKEFADSDDRIARLKRLVDRAHDYGVGAGIDAPITFAQQHSYRLLRKTGELPAEIAEIDMRLDWLAKAGWDFYGIESGSSEFTHADPARQLAWMNEVTKHLADTYDRKIFVKVHCSTGQVADGYLDPSTGKPINFNMLPHFADARLGVLPHTVQHYGLTDPAPTYGNTDFGYIRDFLHQEIGKRPVVFYPETAYWVSFDVDVPLFLPLYADRRLSDLRLIAADEDEAGGARMDGQMFFSSGWEWGYWLNDVVAARSAWDPELSATSQATALTRVLGRASRVFGSASGEVVTWIADVVAAEQQLLIEGRVAGKAPATIAQRNGQAYLQGWETWDDVNELAVPGVPLVPTQPSKLGLVDMRNPLHGGPKYTAEIDPLLTEMEARFTALAARGDALRSKVPASAKDLIDDLADAMRMTALRSTQVHGLYDYVDGYLTAPAATRVARLATARKALDDAAVVVKAREPRYRVPADRIGGWRDNPTAYEYGYLWSVRSLHYWWRDEGKAIDHPLFPCYMNVVNPVQVAFGEGMGTDAARLFGGLLSSDQSRGCLAEPTAEPKYPQDDLRSRP